MNNRLFKTAAYLFALCATVAAIGYISYDALFILVVVFAVAAACLIFAALILNGPWE